MFGNLLFGLTSLTYIALTIYNIQKLNVTGERLVGAGLMAFALMAAYVVFSLLLTISIVSKGGFSWISNSVSTRNIAVGILWFGMVAGVVFCSMLTTEYHTDTSTGIFRLLSLPVYFGGVWLPLLMLVPYAILLNSGWRDAASPYLYKLPLLVGCITGILILIAPQLVATLGIKVPQKTIDTAEVVSKNIKNSINSETSIKQLLQYSNNEDERVRRAAANKIKTNPDWEGELIKILQENDQYGFIDFYWVYVFMDDNQIEHPERFIEPINNTIPALTSEAQEVQKKSFLYSGDWTFLNIDVVCRVLDKQFKNSSSVFKPNMLKLDKALQAPTSEKSDTDKDFIEIRNKYSLAVKNWLDSN